MLMVVGFVSASQAVIIDDFQSYTSDPAGTTTIEVQTGDVWHGVGYAGTTNPRIRDDGAGNQFLTNYGISNYNNRGAYMSLGADTVADTYLTTLDFDIWAATDTHDISFGLGNGGTGTWGDLEAYITFAQNGDIQARNGGSSAVIAAGLVTAGTVYHVQIVADLGLDTYDVFIDGTQYADDFGFRNGLAVKDLDVLKIYGWGGVTSDDYVAVDNIEMTTVVPEPATLALLGLGALVLRRKR